MRKARTGFSRFWDAYGDKTAFLREKKWRFVVGILGFLLVLWSAYSGTQYHDQHEAAKSAASEQSSQEYKYLND